MASNWALPYPDAGLPMYSDVDRDRHRETGAGSHRAECRQALACVFKPDRTSVPWALHLDTGGGGIRIPHAPVSGVGLWSRPGR